MTELRLKGSAIITGGARRIGRAIALSLASLDYQIILHYHSSADEAKETARQIRAMGQQCHLIGADFLSMRQVAGFMAKAFTKASDCHLLVNNASVFERSKLMATEDSQLDRHLNVNLRAPVVLSRDFARHCQQGQIINILDTRVSRNLIAYFAYTLSKKALFEFTKMAAIELAPRIRVNAICPGWILPQKDEQFQTFIEKIPLQKMGRVEDVCSAVSFLLNNDFITGQCLYVDGGEHLK